MNKEQLQISKTIAKGSGIVFLGMVLSKLLHFPTSIIIARYFGPRDYGLLAIANTFAGIIASISVLGMGMGITRFMAYHRKRGEWGELRKILHFGAKTVLLTSLPASILVFLTSPWVAASVFKDPDLTGLIRIASLSIPCAAMLQYGTGLFRGLKKLHYIVYYNDLASPLLRLLFLLLIVFMGLRISHVAVSQVFVTLMTLGLAFYIFTRDELLGEVRERKPKGSVGEFIRYSFPLAITIIVRFARRRFDLLVIGAFVAVNDAGIYNVAMTIALLLTIPLTGINRILLPVASDLFSAGRNADLAITYKTMSRWCLTAVLPFFLFILFFAEEVILLFYGSEYASAADSLRIIALGFCVNASMGSFGEFLQAHGKSGTVMTISVVGALLNIGCLFTLIPVYGIEGAALSFSISMIAMNIMGIYSLMVYGIHPFSKKYLCVLLIGITLYPPLFTALRNMEPSSLKILWVSVAFLIGLFFYGLMLFYLNAFSREEKVMLLNAKRKIAVFGHAKNFTNAS